MDLPHYALVLLAASLTRSLFLWIGLKVMETYGSYPNCLAVAVLADLIGLVPYVGLPAKYLVMVFLLSRWTRAHVWPHAVVIVLISEAGMYLFHWLVRGPFGSFP
ncbi:MAG: hypothetical protein HY706_04805 [Candidatus Hydrogenedentes bacterium]|nr:hypothetical protein [Candidatus Hydrogenedentota bacterium]